MRWGRMHEGIDIGCAYGTPNRAAAAGTVIYAGWLGGYGNLVVVDHGNGLSTAYAHASAILVSVGQTVSQGETVSLVGATGHVDRAAPALRGSRQRRRRRPAAVSVRRSGGLGGRARECDRADEVEIGERAPALVEAEPIAGEQLVRHGEADEAKRELVDEAAVGAVEKRDRSQARGLAQTERSAEEVEREPRVDDVLDEEHMAAGERRVDVLQEPYASVLAVGVRGELDHVERVGDPKRPREIGEEHDARLQRRDEDGIEPVVLARDLRPSSATRAAISSRVRWTAPTSPFSDVARVCHYEARRSR